MVVREFLDMFLKEIPRLPRKRDIGFEIELKLGACPILKPPYRMGQWS